MGKRNKSKRSIQQAVMIANGFEDGDQEKAVSRAKNAVSSAYANSTDAERQQLHQFQDQLEKLQ